MSTITSSAINKGKTVAPKAVARRKPFSKQATSAQAAGVLPSPEPSQAEHVTVQAPPQDDLARQDVIEPANVSVERLSHDTSNAQAVSTAARPETTLEGQEAIAADVSAQQAGQRQAPKQVAGVKRKRGLASAAPATRQIGPESSTTAPATSVAEAEAQLNAPMAKRGRGRPRKAANVAPTQDNAEPRTKRGKISRAQTAPAPSETADPARNGVAAAQAAADATGNVDTPPDARSAHAGQHAEQQHTEGTVSGSLNRVMTEESNRAPRKTRRREVRAEVVEQGAEAAEDPAEEDVEDPENVVIDEDATAMSDLMLRNRAVGKGSEREKLMAAIDWGEVARKRREQSAPRAQVDTEAMDANNSGTAQAQSMQYRILNGEIILDEASTHIDRQAQAVANAELAVVDENADLTKRVNRMTWINDRKRDPAERVSIYKAKSDPWNDGETDRFYEALRMFGTDFEIISKMFPPRTRRQIKLKFVREERLDPRRIEVALSGGQIVKMDLAHYAAESGVAEEDFKDPAAVLEELARNKKDQEADIEKRAGEVAEAQKQRDLMNEQRTREKGERERQRQAQKQQRDGARRRKKPGRGNEVHGDGSL